MDTHGSTRTEHVHTVSIRKPSLPFPLTRCIHSRSSSKGHSAPKEPPVTPWTRLSPSQQGYTSKATFTWPTVPSSSCQQKYCPRAAVLAPCSTVWARTVCTAPPNAPHARTEAGQGLPAPAALPTPAQLSGGCLNANNNELKGRNSQRLLVRATNHGDMLSCHMQAPFSLWPLPPPRAGSRSVLLRLGFDPLLAPQPRRRQDKGQLPGVPFGWHLYSGTEDKGK